MKKINMSPKAKKGLIIMGSALICVGIAAMAMTLTAGTPAKAEPESSKSSSCAPIINIAPIEENSAAESRTPTFVPESGASQTTELTKIEKPTSAPPAPVIEGDSSKTSDGKETPPTNPVLTDKNHKPSYTKPPVAPAPSKPSPTKPSASQPVKDKPTKPADNKTTENKSGKVYVEGFGWIDDIGEGEETTANDMYEDGVKVGIMD